MDDFSWGNTRIVVGEDGKRQIFVKDEEPFDPDEIPMKTWAEYEGEIHKRQQQIQDLEAVAQAIDEFANNGVRPVSRFTHIPGFDHLPAANGLEMSQVQHSNMSLYNAPPPAMAYDGGAQGSYSPAGFSAYFGSMAAASPQAVATSCFNLVQVPGTHMPTDDALAAAISSILDVSDLSTITMKIVRDELSRMFGIDMSPRREFISQTVQAMIQRRV
ncbi:hypothetical protein H4S07_006782 [Coemansia furcata]|uniref:Uncharacterized protein n=1 Tax=Coemansia furcata TaxID=417177 RepID=A0ACC1KSN0_9FUNG|nr:hypothetical protein H4S07_006782 [Coemansia furcata]